jgi:hypothetical protein
VEDPAIANLAILDRSAINASIDTTDFRIVDVIAIFFFLFKLITKQVKTS